MLLTNSLINCKSTSPGITNLWLTNWERLLPFLVFSVEGFLIDITKSLLWYEVNVSREDTYEERFIRASKSFNTTINVFYPFEESGDQKHINELLTCKVIAIVRQTSGKYYIVGIESPLKVDTYSNQTGAFGGKGGHSIEIKGSSFNRSYLINPSYIDTNLLTPVACPTMAYSEAFLGNTLDCPVY